MRTRRQFQPALDGLPYRIAPSGLLVAPQVSIMAAHAAPLPVSPGPSFTQSGAIALPDDTDMPQTGTSTPIILAPPDDGTVVC